MQPPKTIKIITAKNLRWLNVTMPGSKEMAYLAEQFKFDEMDLRECPPPLQRPKLVRRAGYLFMILQFPVYNRKSRSVNTAEVDFFIGQDFLVVVHSSELEVINNFFYECQKFEGVKNKYFAGNPANLLYELLNRLIVYCFPMLNHISLDVDNIEKGIFSGQQKRMLSEILIIKRNIVNFRKAMQPHKNVIKKLIADAPEFFPIDQLNIYFNNLVDYTKEIWDLLENYKDTIDALQQTNESLISFRLNDIMKTLTIFSVIILPLSLLAGIFGMNTTDGMPFLQDPIGFWKILIVMVIGTFGMLAYFKKKRWL